MMMKLPKSSGKRQKWRLWKLLNLRRERRAKAKNARPMVMVVAWRIYITKVSSPHVDDFDNFLLIREIGEGHFDDGSNRPSGAATPIPQLEGAKGKKVRKSGGKKAKTAKQRLAMADGDVDMG